MPYRDALETVLRRCDELAARLEDLRRALHLEPGERHDLVTIDEALAEERELRAELALLERRFADAQTQAHADAEDGMVAMTRQENVAPIDGPPWRGVVAALVALLVMVGVLAAANLSVSSSRARPIAAIYRGTVTEAPSAIAETGSACEATIRLAAPTESRGARRPCSVRVQCGVWERTFEEATCDFGDGELSLSHADEGLDLDTTTHELSFTGSMGSQPAPVRVRLAVPDAP